MINIKYAKNVIELCIYFIFNIWNLKSAYCFKCAILKICKVLLP